MLLNFFFDFYYIKFIFTHRYRYSCNWSSLSTKFPLFLITILVLIQMLFVIILVLGFWHCCQIPLTSCVGLTQNQLFNISWSAGFKVCYLKILLCLAIGDSLIWCETVDYISFFFKGELFGMFYEFVIWISNICLPTMLSDQFISIHLKLNYCFNQSWIITSYCFSIFLSHVIFLYYDTNIMKLTRTNLFTGYF